MQAVFISFDLIHEFFYGDSFVSFVSFIDTSIAKFGDTFKTNDIQIHTMSLAFRLTLILRIFSTTDFLWSIFLIFFFVRLNGFDFFVGWLILLLKTIIWKRVLINLIFAKGIVIILNFFTLWICTALSLSFDRNDVDKRNIFREII